MSKYSYPKILFIIILGVICLLSSAYASNDLGIYNKNVLIIQSYARDYMHTREIEAGIELFFKECDHRVSFRYEFLDTKNYFTSDFMENLKYDWEKKYKNVKLDGILLCDDDALIFYKRYGKEIFDPSIPVVAIGINSVKPYEPGLEGVILLEERPNYEKNIDLALMQNQHADTIHFIYDITTTSQQVHAELVPLLDKKYPNIVHTHHINNTPEELKECLSKAKTNEIFFLVIYSRSPKEDAYIYDEVSRYLSQDAPVPIYVFWEFYLNSGVIGGYVASSIKYGETGASLLNDMWNGENLEPIIYEKGLNHRYVFDYLITSKFNMTDFPKDAVFINKPENLWTKYYKFIIGFILFSAVLMLIIFLQYRNVKLHQIENFLLRKNEDIQKDIQEKLEAEVDLRTREYQLLNTKLEMALLLTEDKNKEILSINHQLSNTIDTLKNTQLKLIESEKMASLGSLVSGISHEINTPLGVSLTGNSYILENFKRLYPKYQTQELKKSELDQFLSDIHHLIPTTLESLNQAIALVNAFKQIAISHETHSMRRFNLKDYTEETLKILKPLFEQHQIAIEFDSSSDIFYTGDPNWFFQIINQFIDNSIKHGFKNVSSSKLIVLELTLIQDEVQLTYLDNGNGMTKESLNHVFDPFFTTERNLGTGGIGLYVVYNIVTSGLNGTIVCSSEENGGITFTIKFPLQPQ